MWKMLFCMTLLVFIVPQFSCANHQQATEKSLSTGPCTYKHYSGQAKIVSIEKSGAPKTTGGPSYQQYEVRFLFTTGETLDHAYAHLENQQQSLTLTNSWHPGPEFLRKYGIEVGKSFDCTLGIIQKGTCSPVVFDFPGIDRSDYFENTQR